MEPDFSGWATKNDLKCSDGRTIRAGAFAHMDKKKVPLIWSHQHNDPDKVLGHGILENRAFGTYVYGYFNQTPQGKKAKQLVQHGDIESLSIYANNLIQQGGDVTHGDIREVSLVLAGANRGAVIENVNLVHSDGFTELIDEEAIIHTGLPLEHNDQGEETVATETKEKEKTVQDVYNEMTDEQKDVLHYMVGEALESKVAEHSAVDEDEKELDGEAVLAHIDTAIQEGFNAMTRNVFEQNAGTKTVEKPTLSHDQVRTIVDDASRYGSLKESFLAHAAEYGIEDIDLLFPDAKALATSPELLKRQTEWVSKVLGATKHTPFAKIKSLVADLTAEEARAKGYVKGAEKKEEIIKLLRRTTGPSTIYKKQKLDRDDILDITDFDVVAFLKAEMRLMLNEELARAILIGDGRTVGHDDKISDPAGDTNGTGIRAIANDHDMYAHKVTLPANVATEAIIEGIARSRQYYRGSGTPTLFTTDGVLTDMLLEKDKMGRRLYATEAELASVLRVKEIVAVEVMEEVPEILGIMVNLQDYSIGTNKGGELSFFEDFDIDFNQNKYLLETRLSGALVKLKSAVVIKRVTGTQAIPTAPSFDGETDTITVPSVTGVSYLIDDEVVTGTVVITEPTTIVAVAEEDYYFAGNTVTEWTFVPQGE